MEESDTEKIIEDVKERKFQTREYSLDLEPGAKAVESIPASAVGRKESLKVVALDDLHVSFFSSIKLTLCS